MKNLFLVFVLAGIGFVSCQSAGEAERVADEFHQKLDAHEHDYIINNLIDPDEVALEGDAWSSLLEQVASWGEIKNREKETGFNYKSNDGVSTVKLNYTFENDFGKIYEAIVLADKGEGYKVMVLSFNQDREKVEEYTAAYD